jgi:hypothetical protein
MVWLVNKISEYSAQASGHRDERGVGANAARQTWGSVLARGHGRSSVAGAVLGVNGLK